MIPQAVLIRLAAEFLIPFAEELVKQTDNKYDDALVEGIKFLAGMSDTFKETEEAE